MFDFNDTKLTDGEIAKVASESNLPPLHVAINANGYRQSNKFWCSAEEMLCVKLDPKLAVVTHKIHDHAKRGKGVVGVRSTYEAIRKSLPFVGRNGVMNVLKDNILPALQDTGIICVIGDKIYAHPALIGMDGRDVYKWCNAWRAVERRKAQSKLRSSSDLIHGYDADEVEKAIQFYRKAKSLLNGE